MSDRSALTQFSSIALQKRHFRGSTLLSDYWALTKPEVSFLILITTLWGFI
jgi:heme O synthase-like polyprenyltransferase